MGKIPHHRTKKCAEKAVEHLLLHKYAVDDVFYELDKKLAMPVKGAKKSKDRKEIDLPSRLFYNNPTFVKLTRKQMQKLKDLINEVKSNIYEGEDMM